MLVPQWNKRWFSIERHLLKWYASPQADKASGVVDLRFVTDIAAFEAQSGAHSFVLAGPDRNLLLRATSSAEMEKWMRALQYQADIVRGGDGTGVVTDSTSFCLSPQGKGRAIKDKYKPSTLEATLEAAMARLQVLESEVSKKTASPSPVKGAPREPAPAALRGAQLRDAERDGGHSVRGSRSFVREDASGDGAAAVDGAGGVRDSRDGLRFNRPMMSPQRKIQSAQRAGGSRHHGQWHASDDEDESGGDKHHSDGERPRGRAGGGGSGGLRDQDQDQDQRQQHRARAVAVGRPRDRDRDAPRESFDDRERESFDDRERERRAQRADALGSGLGSEDEAADSRPPAHRAARAGNSNNGSVRSSRESAVDRDRERERERGDRDGQLRSSRDSEGTRDRERDRDGRRRDGDGALPPRHSSGEGQGPARRPPPSQPKWDQDFDDGRGGPGGHARPAKGGKPRPGPGPGHSHDRQERRAPGGAPPRRAAPARGGGGDGDLVVSDVDDLDALDHELRALSEGLQVRGWDGRPGKSASDPPVMHVTPPSHLSRLPP